MHRPALRRTRKLFRNVRAVWQFLKPHPAIHSSKPRFTRLGLQWKHVDRAGTVRRTYTKESTRRYRLLRKLLRRYGIQFRPYMRDTVTVKADRYRLAGWSFGKQTPRPKGKAAEFIETGPWIVGPKNDREETALRKSGHPTSTPEPSRKPHGLGDTADAAYGVDMWDCIDVEFHSRYCGCPECVPAAVVGDFTVGSEGAKTTTRRTRTRKKT